MPLATEEQVTFNELLTDPVYAMWLKKVPKAIPITFSGKPWRVWVQRERGGKWGRIDFTSYPKAYNWAMRRRKQYHDMAICDKINLHHPPVVKRRGKKEYYYPGVPGMNPHHQWCVLCRRPTIFTWFSRHHAFPQGRVYLPSEQRCAICGGSETLARSMTRRLR